MIWLGVILCLFCFSACSSSGKDEVDRLNDISYSYHYRNIDSTRVYAERALAMSQDYDDGRAEAYNNLAFVSIARMEYAEAYKLLDSVAICTDNQVELLISYIQKMRLCQRESRNKDFYNYREFALRALRRIEEDCKELPERLQHRMIYARSELSIITSIYYYYVGLDNLSIDAIKEINPNGEILKDTAQYMNYLYQVGAGGIISEGTKEEINQKEWEYLMRCYMMSLNSGNVYWEANSLQAMSEHLTDAETRTQLIENNPLTYRYINSDDMPDSLLAGYLAQKSLEIFLDYGDVYQIAGTYRSLASCYWELNDYESALICLDNALNYNKAIEQAPDLVASIRERLSITYSAIDNKAMSDLNRNLYLDMQEKTRQDRQLEARAEQLDHNASQLNMMISAVVFMIMVVVFSIFMFSYLRRKKDHNKQLERLLAPLDKWQTENGRKLEELSEKSEEISEAYALSNIHIENNKRRNMENRAKVFLVNSIMPLIDRMIHEVERLLDSNEPENVRTNRYEYITELTDKINDNNNVLTGWIQLQQGQLDLRIESFCLQELFDIVQKSRMSFALKGINLEVGHTEDVVKADKILTLFMINTIADNARKFTGEGGSVRIASQSTADYVEISVEDTGKGMSQEEVNHIFEHKISGGHGFGLLNCKGIIEKYRKISKVFSVCSIAAESEQGKGSRFYFRLPKGLIRLITALMCLTAQDALAVDNLVDKAKQYADSAYYCNIKGDYRGTILWADSVRECLNRYYLQMHPEGKRLMVRYDGGSEEPAEVKWFREGFEVDYIIILDMRNESAVASLALHEWELYAYNNKVYTQLYKETSADKSLGEYIQIMQRSETNKYIAVVLLVVLLFVIIVVYYLLYYRPLLYFRFCVEQVNSINDMLMEDTTDKQKLHNLDTRYSIQKFPDSLKDIVEKIRAALESGVKTSEQQQMSIELAEDELRRAEYENQKLYVSNNVLDNCLSTLKHETMYYPSRIRQLIDGTEDNLQAIQEVVLYYKQLYSILSTQAMRQIDPSAFECRSIRIGDIKQLVASGNGKETRILGDYTMIRYLFEILQKQSGEKTMRAEISEKDNKYVIINIRMPLMPYRDIFTPSTQNIPFLICRQIIRENIEVTNMHGCGIVAIEAEEGMVIRVTLAKDNGRKELRIKD